MSKIPASARLASILLILEPWVEALVWQILRVPFIFFFNISSAESVANNTIWAIFHVFSAALLPFLRQEANLGEIPQNFGGSKTRKDLKDVYNSFAKSKAKAESWNAFISCAIWAVLLTAFFRYDSFFVLHKSHWLSKLVSSSTKHSYIRYINIAWILSSRFRIVIVIRFRILLFLQALALNLFFFSSYIVEVLVARSVYFMLCNIDRFGWVLWQISLSLFRQFLFEIIVSGLFRYLHIPITNWGHFGFDFYLFMKASGVIWSLWNIRHQYPRRTLWKTNWAEQEKYHYTPLNTSKKTIRLLVLHPRILLSDIRCTLFEVSLDNMPSYEAISYTWSNTKERENIWLNGKRLNISKSTHTVLSNRSSFWKPRILWIDAICINQDDILERNSQVSLMRKIYKRSFTVSVCLQIPLPKNETTPIRYHVTEAILAGNAVRELTLLGLNQYQSDLDIYLHYAGQIRQPIWLAFFALVRNPWFNRIWVVQEVALATSLRVFYGRIPIPWPDLVEAFSSCAQYQSLSCFLMTTKDPLTCVEPPTSPLALHIMSSFREELKSRDISFASALFKSNSFNATDPRDRVFGLYGFYDETSNADNKKVSVEDENATVEDVRIKPDYGKTEIALYKHVGQYLLEQKQPLRLLSYAGVGFFPREEGETLPTWCPNWAQQSSATILSSPELYTDQYQYNAGGSSIRNAECCSKDNSTSLAVRGRIVGSILSLGPILPIMSFSKTGSSKIWSLKDYLKRNSEQHVAVKQSLELLNSSILAQKLFPGRQYPRFTPHQDLQEAFWRTLIGNRSKNENPAPDCCSLRFQKWLKFYDEVLSKEECLVPTKGVSPDMVRPYVIEETFASLIVGCGLGRRLCITENGLIGMVPPLSVQGDEKFESDVIYVIQGAQVPFVLRPVKSEDHSGRKKFELVGEAYIHGIMNGEMAKWEDKNSGEELIELI